MNPRIWGYLETQSYKHKYIVLVTLLLLQRVTRAKADYKKEHLIRVLPTAG